MTTPITIELKLTLIEFAAISETADLNNACVDDWAKRVVLNATVANDEKRFAIRKEIYDGASHSAASIARHSAPGRDVTLVIPPDLFTGACTCRPIFAEGGLIVAGEDNCPVHGFSDDD